jgi:hypothetical protein
MPQALQEMLLLANSTTLLPDCFTVQAYGFIRLKYGHQQL